MEDMHEFDDMISIRQAVDLLAIGPEHVRQLGEEPRLQARIPYLLWRMQNLVEILDELGVDAIKLLARDKRLKALTELYIEECAGDLEELATGIVDFQMAVSPLYPYRKLIGLYARKLPKSEKLLLFEAKENSVTVGVGGWRIELPATVLKQGRILTTSGVFKAMLELMKRDECIRCRLEPQVYYLNNVKIIPPPAATTLE